MKVYMWTYQEVVEPVDIVGYSVEAADGSIGKVDEAKEQVATVLRLRPDFTIRLADAYYRMWCFESDYREKMRAGLRAAGLPE